MAKEWLENDTPNESLATMKSKKKQTQKTLDGISEDITEYLEESLNELFNFF